MKNNTKVRLHLSKQLFESLAKQVLTEAKGKKNFGAGMEEVKATKGKKEEGDKGMKSEAPASGFSSRDFAEKGSPRAKPNSFTGDSPKKPGAAKGASKQQVAVDLVNKGRNLAKDPKANIQSAEGGRLLDIISNLINLSDDPNNSSMVLDKVSRLLAQNQPKAAGLEEMETMTAEGGKVDEIEGYTGMHPDTAQLLGTIGNIIAAAGGVAGAIALMKDYFGAGSKEAKDVEAIAKKATKAAGEKEPKA